MPRVAERRTSCLLFDWSTHIVKKAKDCAIKQQTKTAAAKIKALLFGSLVRSPGGIGGAAAFLRCCNSATFAFTVKSKTTSFI